MTGDYKGSDFTFTATAANPDIINESGNFSLNQLMVSFNIFFKYVKLFYGLK